ncbi:hypothetical protein CO178_01345 [candidate division WWE3 bacterium CG_4_9_14_3_um_filter_34_6]|uniref:Major facilitator superfamily (MFS) profile domain-containing protein n=1 Tax=candidate division WWE3 bacterium CG_4_9_14_3_um_filter_34_6 TaxID=1975079 RepID=A0A2M7X414_UNCKA|nr:MAG: hypothetical protein CO178_01345 [candidate division WWE3 bacterium CG_4_9_14_3_um_filter_34_6]
MDSNHHEIQEKAKQLIKQKKSKFFILKNREFLKLWSAQVFSQLAINLLNFVLAVTVYDTTHSNQSVSYVVISFGLAAFLFGAPAGVFVDKMDKKKTLFYSTAIRFLVVLLFLFITHSLWITIAIAFVLNSVTQFFFPAEAASIAILVEKKYLLSANSLYTITYYLTQIVGYMGAGLMLTVMDYREVLIIITVLFLVASFFISLIKFPKQKGELNVPSSFFMNEIVSEFKDGLRYIRNNKKIQIILTYLGLSQIMIGMFVSLLPGYAVTVLGLKVHDSGLYLIGPSILGMIVAAATLSLLKSSNKIENKIINIGAIFAAISIFAMALTQRIPIERVKQVTGQMNGFQAYLPNEINKFLGVDLIMFAVIFMFLVGFSNSLVVIVNSTKLQRETDEKLRGRVFGVLQTIVTVTAFLPVVLTGYLADTLGVNKVLFIVAIFILLVHLSILKIRSKIV